MEQKDLFRKSALEKLASPERLDVLMQVTSPAGWVALWTVAFVLAGFAVWLFIGSMPERIDGQGILISGGGLREIKATGAGTVTTLSVGLRASVTADQLIGEVTLGGTEDAMREAKARVEAAQQAYDAGRAEDAANVAGVEANIAGQQAEIRRIEGELTLATANLKRREEQFEKRIVTQRTVEEARFTVSQLDSRLIEAKSRINSYQTQRRSYQEQTRRRLQAVETAQRELGTTTNQVARTTQIKSEVEGIIVELQKKPGDQVRVGETIAVVQPPSAVLQAIVYVDSSTGKRIRADMDAQISPSTVRREEHGFMKAKVQYVSDFPATRESMMGSLRNSAFVEEMLGASSKLEMRATLVPDPATPSGYQWSSSRGPDHLIDSGTRISVSVVVERRRPISKVLPFVRSTFGAS